MDNITYDTNFQVQPERLNDQKFPWISRKKETLRFSDIYAHVGYADYAERAKTCTTWLQYYVGEGGEKQLQAANFCNLRLCPLCTARRARRAAWKLTQVLDKVQADHVARFVFLTLTIRNCSGDDLGATITHLFQAWDRLRKQRRIDRSIRGWFRALEITHNRETHEYHPHLHVILAVEPQYFWQASPLYIQHSELVSRWRQALRVDYDPSVHIQKTKSKDGGRSDAGAAVEAAKYATKSDDIISPYLTLGEAAKICLDYTHALHHRRATAYGGWLLDAARQLDAVDLDGGDLVRVDDDQIRPDLVRLVEDYRWSFGQGDYLLADRRAYEGLKTDARGQRGRQQATKAAFTPRGGVSNDIR